MNNQLTETIEMKKQKKKKEWVRKIRILKDTSLWLVGESNESFSFANRSKMIMKGLKTIT